jgi:23S rRNA (guanosine2251-2'-O)-methyltransferase
VTAVVIPKDRSSQLTPAAVKASAGASESVPVVTVTNLAASIVELVDAGVLVVGTAGEAEKSIYEIDSKGAVAWVLGAEGDGLRQLTRRRCSELAKIPMFGSVESLNVSVAAGICLYETVRQRLAK